MSNHHVDIVLLAAGEGSRFGGVTPKQLLMIGQRPLFCHVARQFIDHEAFRHVIIVVPTGQKAFYTQMVKTYDPLNHKQYYITEGGRERYDSVACGLSFIQDICAVKSTETPKYVWIHDVARPCVGYALINRLLENMDQNKAVLPAVPIVDTLRYQGKNTHVDRTGLMAVQTPQVFGFQQISSAYDIFMEQKSKIHALPTDDAQIFERFYGHSGQGPNQDPNQDQGLDAERKHVVLIKGDPRNIKITYEHDLQRVYDDLGVMDPLIKTSEKASKALIKTGIGYDVHAYDPSKNTIILGGVSIDHNYGLLGHSDADVVLHALVDALFGCIAEGDIGDHFPPTDQKWKNADSTIFVAYALDLLRKKAVRIHHIDCSMIAEHPKLQKHKKAIAENIATLCNLQQQQVNVKATTSEKLGFIGRGEGMACIVTVTAQ
jgi:2-C-methyl-D-erythritol 4-phosphate cytidylyltransferase/2-C-methyl-D-erythritol 2,4-cyclodiphosphate synthase